MQITHSFVELNSLMAHLGFLAYERLHKGHFVMVMITKVYQAKLLEQIALILRNVGEISNRTFGLNIKECWGNLESDI